MIQVQFSSCLIISDLIQLKFENFKSDSLHIQVILVCSLHIPVIQDWLTPYSSAVLSRVPDTTHIPNTRFFISGGNVRSTKRLMSVNQRKTDTTDSWIVLVWVIFHPPTKKNSKKFTKLYLLASNSSRCDLLRFRQTYQLYIQQIDSKLLVCSKTIFVSQKSRRKKKLFSRKRNDSESSNRFTFASFTREHDRWE